MGEKGGKNMCGKMARGKLEDTEKLYLHPNRNYNSTGIIG